MNSPVVDAHEAARYLGVSIHSIRGWTSKGRLPVRKVGRRALYHIEDLQRVLAEGLPKTSGK
jgi:excisionase family DNA binding protein